MAVLSTPRFHQQLDAPAPLRLWHLTSLDAPTVAVVWTFAFAWAVHIALPLWLPIVVGLSAWSLYIADRLMDARQTQNAVCAHPQTAQSLRTRHHFHWRYRRILLPVALAAAIAALALVLRFMPIPARERDSVLAVAALAYFGSVHLPKQPRKFSIPKEFLVAVLFTLACATPAWTRLHAHRITLLAPVLCFMALAWLNCLAIEAWESGMAPQRTTIRRLGLLLAASTLLAAIIAAASHQLRIAALLAAAALSATLLAFLDHRSSRLRPLALRIAADLALLTPILLTPVLLPFA